MAAQKSILLGAHMSAAGGLEKALLAGTSIGCTAIQLFTKSNQQWATRTISTEESTLFKATRDNSAISSVVAHASYLINIASSRPELVQKSIEGLHLELERCNTLGIDALILHPGAYTDGTLQEGLAQAIRSINHVLAQVPKGTKLLIENMAGQGTTIGSNLEELAALIQGIDEQQRIGVCIDTCHLFAAGIDISAPEHYQKFWERFEKLIGIQKLGAIHMNDSVKSLGSRLDRHCDIGKGHIGLATFAQLLNDTKLDEIPKILETPKTKGLEEDKINLGVLVNLLDPEHRSQAANTPLSRYFL